MKIASRLLVLTLAVLVLACLLPGFSVDASGEKPTEPQKSKDPCAHGHTFDNGFCIYCAEHDPNYNPCAEGHVYVSGYCKYCLAKEPMKRYCVDGHTFVDGYCVICTYPDPLFECKRGNHNFVGGICIECFEADPNYENPCANGHDLDENGSCRNCSYYDTDIITPIKPDHDAAQPSIPDPGGFYVAARLNLTVIFVVEMVASVGTIIAVIIILTRKKK